MIRIIAVLLPLSIAFLHAPAQDPGADKILKSLQEKTRTYQTIQAEFTYSVSQPAEEQHESLSGILYIKGDSYRLSLAGQLVVCDGETSWTYFENVREIQINSVEEEDESISPSKIFSSVFQDYTSHLSGEYEKKDRILHKIELTPQKSKSFSRITLGIDTSAMEIVDFEVTDKSGNRYSYHINRFSTNLPLGDDKFTFNVNAFPDAEIIDMR